MGEALPTAAFTSMRRWLFSRRLNPAGQLPVQSGLLKPALRHAWRETVASVLGGSTASFDDPLGKNVPVPAFLGFIPSRRFLATPCVPWNLTGGKRRGDSSESTNKNPSSSVFLHVDDKSNHWLPCLAAKAAQQESGHLLSEVFGAAKGDCTSADPSRLQHKAMAATTRSGWNIPPVAVVVFDEE
ncbi:hypothetical protein ACSSS7_001574 [Eimeria intestinalis]